MFSGMVLLKMVVTAIVQTIDPAVAPDSTIRNMAHQEKSNPSLGKNGMRFRNNSNENADD
jgi:hypothetical protein